MKIREMKNIGKVNEEKLMQVGIMDSEDLINIGAKEAFLLIKKNVDDGACLHLLYGLEAGIQGVAKKDLSSETKEDLKKFFNEQSAN